MVGQGERRRKMRSRSVLQNVLPAAWESMFSTGDGERVGFESLKGLRSLFVAVMRACL